MIILATHAQTAREKKPPPDIHGRRPRGISMWKIDLHSHTIYSKDCLTRTADFIARARAVGLDKIAVTEHNRLDGALAAQGMAPDLVIAGVEIMTTHGEIIGYFMEAAEAAKGNAAVQRLQEVPRRLSPQETIQRLRDQGAVITIPHPLDSIRRSAMGVANVLQIIDQVDALEVLNARCVRPQDNAAAAELAHKHNRLITAGSDAHTLGEIGRCYLRLPPFADNASSFIAALQQAKPGGLVSPFWPHFASTYARWRKRIVPVSLP
jgi:predicted metal-dependent phosphoesterase TrpH